MLAACLAFAGCDCLALHQFLHGSPFWPAKNGDPLRTGASSYVAPALGTPAWTFEEADSGVISATPLIDENRSVYLTSRSGRVYKFDLHGNLLWRYQAHGSLSLSLTMLPSVSAILDGMIFNALVDGTVFALDIATGKERWARKVAVNIGADSFSMTAGDGLLLVPCNTPVDPIPMFGGNTHIIALSTADGSELWTYKPVNSVYNLMASMVNSSIVFEDSLGGLYHLSMNGTELWRRDPPAHAASTTGGAMLGPDGIIYASGNYMEGTTQFGLVSAYRLEDGENIWRKKVDLVTNSGPAVGFLGKKLGIVLGIGSNPDMPSPGPELQFLTPLFSSQLNTGPKPNRALALDAVTGEVLWDYAFPVWHGAAAGDTFPFHICLPDAFANAAIGGDGTAYVFGESGRAYAILDKDADGTISEANGEVSFFDAKNAFQASPAIAPGMIAIAPCNGLAVFLSDTIA